VSIVSIEGLGTDWKITFNGPISINLASPDAALLIGDASFFDATGVVGVAVAGADDGTGGYVSGLAWNLASQPSWLATPIAGPQAGVTI
jgi:hypothetical protein